LAFDPALDAYACLACAARFYGSLLAVDEDGNETVLHERDARGQKRKRPVGGASQDQPMGPDQIDESALVVAGRGVANAIAVAPHAHRDPDIGSAPDPDENDNLGELYGLDVDEGDDGIDYSPLPPGASDHAPQPSLLRRGADLLGDWANGTFAHGKRSRGHANAATGAGLWSGTDHGDGDDDDDEYGATGHGRNTRPEDGRGGDSDSHCDTGTDDDDDDAFFESMVPMML
jgi:hypothetical protein